MQIILHTHTLSIHKYQNSAEMLNIYRRQLNEIRIVNRHDRNASQVTIDLCEETPSASHLKLSNYARQMDFFSTKTF